MSSLVRERRTLLCEVIGNRCKWINNEVFRLDIAWPGPPPRAGQFFLIRPERSGCFLSRPVSAALWEPAAGDARENRAAGSISFMIALRGKGTAELAGLQSGGRAELTGPLGNAWADLLPGEQGGGKIALMGGGIGIAPLIALAVELRNTSYDFYAGFKTMSSGGKEYADLLGPALGGAGEIILATEDGGRGNKGFIPGFLDPARYRAVCACGPEPMLRAAAAKCAEAGTPCFVSVERRMACGTGACLGCTVKTTGGNKRCCADGPIFPAAEILFEG
jgi:NAD(P)H-flavin reductase